MPTRIAIVVTKDGSAALPSLARTQSVWIADTPSNRVAAEAVWSNRQSADLCEVTTFKVNEAEAPDQWVTMILPVIDVHHDLRAEWSSEISLDVHGVGATPLVRAALEEFGPFEIVEWSGGFSANRNRAV